MSQIVCFGNFDPFLLSPALFAARRALFMLGDILGLLIPCLNPDGEDDGALGLSIRERPSLGGEELSDELLFDGGSTLSMDIWVTFIGSFALTLIVCLHFQQLGLLWLFLLPLLGEGRK